MLTLEFPGCMRVLIVLLFAAVLLSSPMSAFATTVRMQTSLGVIDIELMDTAAPATVANFLSYVASGAYVNSFIHRSVPGFIIQGGGYGWDSSVNRVYNIPANAPVVNEFSSSRSNLRGTIAMAKLGGNPNSATNQWFFNLADNSANLDGQNGGFTVFGQVVGDGMQVVDAIAAKPIVNAGSPFDNLPLITVPTNGTITAQNLILITAVTVLPNPPDRTKVNTVVSAGGSANASTSGTAATLQSGYAIAAVNSGNAPYGTAVFSVSRNNVVVSEAGVSLSSPTRSARIFVEYANGVASGPPGPGSATIDINTGIAIVNPSAATSNITYTLRDIQGGTVAIGHGTLGSGAHRARFLNQLQDLAPDFALPATFSASRRGSLEISADQPISVTGLRMTTNQRGDPLFTTIPVADLTQTRASSPVFFPHVVDGDGYISTFILMNTSGEAESGALRFFADNGTPLTIGQAGGANAVFRYAIPPGGTYLFQTAGAFTTARVGSLQLTPDVGNTAPVGAGIFNRTVGGIMITECGIPSALPTTHALVYVDMTNGHDSGLALAGTTASNLPLTLTAYQTDGSTRVGSQISNSDIPANGHSSAYVSQWISGLPANFQGVIDIASSTPFAALTLRFLTNTRQDSLVTSFPVADLASPAPAPPLVFPQIADGGGYKTEFIFLSSGNAVTSTISFFDDDGTPLAVGP
jgi:cyclophilin family peptidyl-prolyl cis-trans isomerase